MTDRCIVCGDDLYIEKHHADGKIHTYMTRNPETNITYEFDTLEEYMKFIDNGRKSWAQWDEKAHKDPENFIWLCGTCHGVLRSKRFTLEILQEAFKWTKLRGCRLTKQMLELYAEKFRYFNNIVELDKHYRCDSKNPDYVHNQEILHNIKEIDIQLEKLVEIQIEQRGM